MLRCVSNQKQRHLKVCIVVPGHHILRQPVFVLFLTEAFFWGFSWLPDAAAPVPALVEPPLPVLASDEDAGGFVSGEESPSGEPPAPVVSMVKLRKWVSYAICGLMMR